jgi:hypothetical protein
MSLSGSLDGAFLTDVQKLDYLYKKFVHGKGFTGINIPYFQEPGAALSRPFVLQSQLWGDDVPATLPSDLFNVSVDDNGSPITGSLFGNTSILYPAVRRYIRVPLEYIPGTDSGTQVSFKGIPDSEDDFSMIHNYIPANLDLIDGSYDSELFSLTGVTFNRIELGDGAYYIDSDSGILTITELIPGVDRNNPPYLSYYRYVGRRGLPLKANVSEVIALDGNASQLQNVIATFIQNYEVNFSISGSSFVYHIDDSPNKPLYLVQGHGYIFDLRDIPATHPFYITRTSTSQTGLVTFDTGVNGNGKHQDSEYPFLEFRVPTNFTGKLYYNTNVDGLVNIGGEIIVLGTQISDTDGDTYISVEISTDDDHIRFFTDNTERMTISNSDRVDITGSLVVSDITVTDVIIKNLVIQGDIIKAAGGLYVSEQVQNLTLFGDTDMDTYIDFEKTTDDDCIRFVTKHIERVKMDETGISMNYPLSVIGDISLTGDISQNGLDYIQERVKRISTFNDLDEDTKIMLEQTPDDDTIRLFTSGIQRAYLSSTGQLHTTENMFIVENIYKEGGGLYVQEQIANISRYGDTDIDTYIEFEKTSDDDTIRLYVKNMEQMFIDDLEVNISVPTDINSQLTAINIVTHTLTSTNTIVENSQIAFGSFTTISIDGDIYRTGGGLYVKEQLGNISKYGDTDEDTYIEFEKTSDDDLIRFFTKDVERAFIDENSINSSVDVEINAKLKVPTAYITTLHSDIINIDTTNADRIYISGDIYRSGGGKYVQEQLGNISRYGDADGDTYIDFEKLIDDDLIRFYSKGIERMFVCDTHVNISINLEVNADIIAESVITTILTADNIQGDIIAGERFNIDGDIYRTGGGPYVQEQIANITLYGDRDRDTYIEFEEIDDDDVIRFYTKGQQRMFINNGPNVTITNHLNTHSFATNSSFIGGNLNITGDIIKDGGLYTDTLANSSRIQDIDNDTYIHVEDTPDNDTIHFVTAGQNCITIDDTCNTTFYGNIFLATGSNIFKDGYIFQTAVEASNVSTQLIKDADEDTYITTEQTPDEDCLRFYTSGLERIKIAPDGNITVFGAHVNVTGDLEFQGDLIRNGTVFRNTTVFSNFTTHVATSIDDIWLKYQNENLHIDNIYAIGELGNEIRVGVGINEPLAMLHLRDGDLIVDGGSADIGSNLRVEGISSLSQVFMQHSNTTNLSEPILKISNNKVTSNATLMSIQSSNTNQNRVDFGLKTQLVNGSFTTEWDIGTGQLDSLGGCGSFYISEGITDSHIIDIELEFIKPNTSATVHIGTRTSQKVDLFISGDIVVNGSTNARALQIDTFIANETDNLLFVNSSRYIMGIMKTNDTGVLMGINNPFPICTLDVNGTICCKRIKQPSDLRLKRNISEIHFDIDDVCKLSAVQYNWKNEPDNTPLTYGFIAQEVEKLYPNMIDTDGNGFKSIYYDQMTTLLLASIKELKERIHILENKIIN